MLRLMCKSSVNAIVCTILCLHYKRVGDSPQVILPMSNGPYRRYVYTIYPDEELTGLDQFERSLRGVPSFRGLCHQLEQCPSTGRIHLQGYVEFAKPQRQSALKKLHATAHWEPAKGTRKQCVAYCTKDETRYAEGVCDPVLTEVVTQGKRNDLLEVTQGITRGEITRDHLFTDRPDLVCKYAKGLNELFNWRARQERMGDRELTVEILHGDAGVGKTRFAYNSTKPDDVFILNKSNSGNLWWDNYEGQRTLVIDDFYGWVEHSVILRILDRYPFRLEIKGSTTWANWTRVYITSNRHPSTWYSKSFPWAEDGALQRRINYIFECKQTIFGSRWTCEKTKKVREISHDWQIREL